MLVRRFAAAFVFVVVTALTAGAQDLVRVKRVVDGDTIILESGERVRLLGVNTPETKHPKKKVEAFGKEAAEFTKRMVEGKLVRLKSDSLASRRTDGKDPYKRSLAYVFLEDGTHLNAEIIRQGYGFCSQQQPAAEVRIRVSPAGVGRTGETTGVVG